MITLEQLQYEQELGRQIYEIHKANFVNLPNWTDMMYEQRLYWIKKALNEKRTRKN